MKLSAFVSFYISELLLACFPSRFVLSILCCCTGGHPRKFYESFLSGIIAIGNRASCLKFSNCFSRRTR